MTEAELLVRVHRNLMEVCSWNGSRLEDGLVEWRDGGLLYSASAAVPVLNGVFRERPAGDAAPLIARAHELFADRGGAFLVYVHPDDAGLGEAAAAGGLVEVMDRYPEMVCRRPLPEPPGDVRPVTDETAAAAYWEICDVAYPSIGFPPETFSRAYTPAFALGADTEACLGYDPSGQPVACATAYMAEGLGMIGWVAARPEARGHGLAAACTVWATNRVFELGGDVASLQASVMGEPIYRSLGYEELYAYRLLATPRA